MKNLTFYNTTKYLTSGNLTQPFLENELIFQKVMTDYNNRVKQNLKANIIESLFNWIHKNVKYEQDYEKKLKLKFQRTSKEIWEDKTSTGCTDYAILFATFARQLNIPTSFLHTAELNWVKRLLNNEDFKHHYGHSFCECFVNNEWVLVDPTCRKIEEKYNISQIELSYKVNDSKHYLPYFRGLDLGNKQTVKEHNKEMDNICYKMYKNKFEQ